MSYKIKQLKWNWIDANGEIKTTENLKYDEKTVTFFDDKSKIVKMAIQAPQGTNFLIDENKFMIGRFGVLEFNDENIVISKVQLLAPEVASLNEEETQKAIEEGIAMMDQALINKLQNTKATMTISKENMNDYGILSSNITLSQQENGELSILEANYSNINQLLTNEDYTSIATEQSFIDAYTKGYSRYIEGARGIYNTDTGKVADIYNVIIDMVIKEEDEVYE